MGKEPRPKREEIEFIFGLFLDGYKDGDVLAKYTGLQEAERLKFPYRTDIRIIRQLREEFAAARVVLEPHLKQQIDPLIIEAKKKHWEELLSLAAHLVSLWEQYNEGHPIGGYDGYIIDTANPLMIEPYGLINCLISHMKFEFSEYQKISEWKDLLKIDTSEEVIMKLALVAHRKTLKGTCLICPQ